VIKTQKK